MRFRTLEIRWHDSKPISSCEFQPVPSFKKARPPSAIGNDERWAGQAYRLATAGEDNNVRLWMVYPNIRPMTAESSATMPAPHPPRVEYLATLSRHSAAVNVVRWSPNGELIASAADDGMIIVWSQTSNPQPATYGSDLSREELQLEKEFWRVRYAVRCTTMQVYDLAWSPTGEYIIAGSTDNCARIYQSEDGKCVHEIAEHSHYVQGVAWDPLNEYIATQSSDRSMHIYHISTPNAGGNKHGVFEAHAVGKNTNMNVVVSSRSGKKHNRTPSAVSEGRGRASSRPALPRRESAASDTESIASEQPSKEDNSALFASSSGPLTPATSVASTPSLSSNAAASSMFPPPPVDKQPSSRRSSFSGSNAPSSPAFSISSRYARSPSPMPALPAIRTATSSPIVFSEKKWKLYGDESYSNFFRRLTFSPDGGLLVTPAGQFEDPEVIPPPPSKNYTDATPSRGRKSRPSISTDLTTPFNAAESNTSSCVYIYTRANFARPPVAQLPGYKKASVAVKFNPVLFDLRPGVSGGNGTGTPVRHEQLQEVQTAILEKGSEGFMDVDIARPVAATPSDKTPLLTPVNTQSQPSIIAPAPRVPMDMSFNLSGSPLLSPMDLRPPTPAASKPGTPVPSSSHTPAPSGVLKTGSVFALPYRMLFAVVTMDTIAIYDTQQSTPFCMLTKLHYDEFTDVTWSPDGQCVLLSSRDGYCTLITFDEILPTHQTQPHSLQLQSIAAQHAVPLDTPQSSSQIVVTPTATPVFGSSSLPTFGSSTPSKKQGPDPPLTPATSVDGDRSTEKRPREDDTIIQEPPKKKRRAALTRVGDLGS